MCIAGAPQFIRPDSMKRRQQFPEGADVRLKCLASGSPTPQVTWLKDGRALPTPLHAPARDDAHEHRNRRFELSLDDVTARDSGVYQCDVINSEGSIRFVFQLTIVERIGENIFLIFCIFLR